MAAWLIAAAAQVPVALLVNTRHSNAHARKEIAINNSTEREIVDRLLRTPNQATERSGCPESIRRRAGPEVARQVRQQQRREQWQVGHRQVFRIILWCGASAKAYGQYGGKRHHRTFHAVKFVYRRIREPRR